MWIGEGVQDGVVVDDEVDDFLVVRNLCTGTYRKTGLSARRTS